MTSSAPSDSAPRVRQRNADRSAGTQAKLIEATIDCLNKVGYAATTTIIVSEVSGVTRGGMLHHFPNRVELIIATAEYCLGKMRQERRARAEGSGRAGSSPTPKEIMAVERGRFGVALTEIMIGSRSDAQLAERFKPVGEMILATQKAAAARIAEHAGISDTSDVEVMVWLNMAAIRGLTLMKLAGIDPGLTDRALDLISANRNALISQLAAAQTTRADRLSTEEG